MKMSFFVPVMLGLAVALTVPQPTFSQEDSQTDHTCPAGQTWSDGAGQCISNVPCPNGYHRKGDGTCERND